MGRRRSAERSIVIRTAITLRPGEDDDLIEFFRACSPRQIAAAIRASLRAGGLQRTGAQHPDTLGAREAQEALENLEEAIDNLL